jgi:MFS transporter, DHA2 family, multidrug resistance protein
LTYEYSWPWIFYINVPIGIVSASLVWFILKDQESEIVRKPIDWMGLFLLSVGVACLQVMLDKGKDLDWFESNIIISLTIVSIIAFLYFCIWTYFQKDPIVDLSHFKNLNFTVGTIGLTVGFLLYFASTVVLPLWLQTEQNFTPLWAGIAVAPIGIIPVLFSTTVGKMSAYVDLRLMAACSFLIFALGFFYQSNFTTQVDAQTIMFSRFLQGFGIVIFFLPLTQLALSEIAPERYASATGLSNFLRILVGSGFGTSLSIELWTRLEIFHHGRLSEFVTSYNPKTLEFYDTLGNNNSIFTDEVIRGILDQQVEQQSFMLSTNDMSWLSAWLFLAMIPLIFLAKKAKPKPAASPAVEA